MANITISEKEYKELLTKSTLYNDKFIVWSNQMKEEKMSFLNYLITVQRLLMLDFAQNGYSDEYINEMDSNTMVLQHMIMHI